MSVRLKDNLNRHGLRGDFVRRSNRGMRFEEGQTVFEFDIEGVFPSEIANMLDLNHPCRAERFFEPRTVPSHKLRSELAHATDNGNRQVRADDKRLLL